MSRRLTAAALLALAGAAPVAQAQTDYYNLDEGRPVATEDAYATERHAFELQLAPVRVERMPGGVYDWEVAPELAYGILPGTQVEVALPIVYHDHPEEGHDSGLGGIEASVLHNLNVETRTLPALALAAGVLLPVGAYAPDGVYPSLRAIATRSFPGVRVHLNGEYTAGDAPGEGEPEVESGRWFAGVALDRPMPLRSMLVVGELYARQPMERDGELEWNLGAGVRVQRSPKLAVDFGVARQLTGAEQGWSLTLGTAYVFAIGSLIPSGGR